MKECLHVWEFLKDMLKESREGIEWLDKSQGIFKIVDPKRVFFISNKQSIISLQYYLILLKLYKIDS